VLVPGMLASWLVQMSDLLPQRGTCLLVFAGLPRWCGRLACWLPWTAWLLHGLTSSHVWPGWLACRLAALEVGLLM